MLAAPAHAKVNARRTNLISRDFLTGGAIGEKRGTMTASGSFEVKLKPQTDEGVGDPTVGRMSIEKEFHGDLEGTSKGQMLAVQGEVKGSAGYVAMERVSGTVAGHAGS